jgi:hypothetical protein
MAGITTLVAVVAAFTSVQPRRRLYLLSRSYVDACQVDRTRRDESGLVLIL